MEILDPAAITEAAKNWSRISLETMCALSEKIRDPAKDEGKTYAVPSDIVKIGEGIENTKDKALYDQATNLIPAVKALRNPSAAVQVDAPVGAAPPSPGGAPPPNVDSGAGANSAGFVGGSTQTAGTVGSGQGRTQTAASSATSNGATQTASASGTGGDGGGGGGQKPQVMSVPQNITDKTTTNVKESGVDHIVITKTGGDAFEVAAFGSAEGKETVGKRSLTMNGAEVQKFAERMNNREASVENSTAPKVKHEGHKETLGRLVEQVNKEKPAPAAASGSQPNPRRAGSHPKKGTRGRHLSAGDLDRLREVHQHAGEALAYAAQAQELAAKATALANGALEKLNPPKSADGARWASYTVFGTKVGVGGNNTAP